MSHSSSTIQSWGRAPQFWSYLRVLGCHLQLPPDASKSSSSNYWPFWLIPTALPISRVRVVGRLVSIFSSIKFTKLQLDDGSGALVGVIVFHNDNNTTLPEWQLGQLYVVQGRLEWFRGRVQVSAMSCQKKTDIWVELMHWMEVIDQMEGQKIHGAPHWQ